MADTNSLRKIAGKEQGLSRITGMLADEQFVYLTMGASLADQKRGESGLRKLAIDSGAVSALESAGKLPQSELGGLAADAAHVYWNAGGSILRSPKQGGAAEVVVAEKVGMGIDLALDAERLYWANHGYHSARSAPPTNPVYHVAKRGGAPEVVADQQVVPHAVQVDAQWVYWVTPRSVMKQAKSKGKPIVLFEAKEGEGVDQLAQDEQFLYFGFRAGGKGRWSLRRIAKSGGEAETLLPKYSLKPIAIAGNMIYFFDEAGFSEDAFCRVPKQGGAVEVLAKGYWQGAIAQNSSAVFVASGSTVSVWRK